MKISVLNRIIQGKHTESDIAAAVHAIQDGSLRLGVETDAVSNGGIAVTGNVHGSTIVTASNGSSVRVYRGLEAASIEVAINHALTALIPTLPIYRPLRSITSASRFFYGARADILVGRANEILKLKSFRDSAESFCWWAVLGAAGIGKSRLALEFGLASEPIWTFGFLASSDQFDWRTWKPSGPTIVVVDYAGGRLGRVSSIIETLAQRSEQLKHPVRLLLLERHLTEEMRVQLFGTGSTRQFTLSTQFDSPLELAALSREQIWSIIETIAKVAPEQEKEGILTELCNIDPSGRPLFAILAAQALAEGRNLRGWNASYLLEFVLRDEKKRWHDLGVDDNHKNLAALATITGGISIAKALKSGLARYFPKAKQYQPQQIEVITGLPAFESIAPLEPDLLGEQFVLSHLGPRHAVDFQRIQEFIAVASRLKTGQTGIFLRRVVQDFYNHATIECLLGPKDHPDHYELALEWISAQSRAGDLKAAHNTYRKIFVQRSRNSPQDSVDNFSFLQALALGDLLRGYLDQGDIKRARAIFCKMCEMSALHFEYHYDQVIGNAASALASYYQGQKDLRSALRIMAKAEEAIATNGTDSQRLTGIYATVAEMQLEKGKAGAVAAVKTWLKIVNTAEKLVAFYASLPPLVGPTPGFGDILSDVGCVSMNIAFKVRDPGLLVQSNVFQHAKELLSVALHQLQHPHVGRYTRAKLSEGAVFLAATILRKYSSDDAVEETLELHRSVYKLSLPDDHPDASWFKIQLIDLELAILRYLSSHEHFDESYNFVEQLTSNRSKCPITDRQAGPFLASVCDLLASSSVSLSLKSSRLRQMTLDWLQSNGYFKSLSKNSNTAVQTIVKRCSDMLFLAELGLQ